MSESDEISKMVKKAAEDRARIERALSPSRTMADLVKAIHPPSYMADLNRLSKAMQPLLHIADIAKAMQPPTHLIAVSQMMSAMQREHRMFADYAHAPRILEDMTKQITQLRTLSESITAPYRELHEMMRLQATIFESLSAKVAAEEQLIGIADAISGFITVPEDDGDPGVILNLNAPYSQQQELLDCKVVEDEKDISALNNLLPTAQTVQVGRRILELVTQCNAAGRTSESGVEIFKPSTRLMTVFSDLPWISATDKLRFGDVIDCLYFIFYEGAGKDNLRFLDKNGGPLADSDCDLIWCIKHLRNKWSRHDPDHGRDKEIQKSWSDLAAKFSWLGLAEYPTEVRHFQQLHHKLLELAEDFLMQILNKLKMKQ